MHNFTIKEGSWAEYSVNTCMPPPLKVKFSKFVFSSEEYGYDVYEVLF